MNKLTWRFTLIAAVAVASFYFLWPPSEKIKLGLDLKGGTSYLLKLDFSKSNVKGGASALQQAIDVIGKRVNRFGVTEPTIQAVGEVRFLVQLPGL